MDPVLTVESTSTLMAGEHRTNKWSTSVHDTHSKNWVSTVGSTSASMAVEHRTDKGSTSVHDTHSKNCLNSWEYICLNGCGTQDRQRIYISTWHTQQELSQQLGVHLPQWLWNTGQTKDLHQDMTHTARIVSTVGSTSASKAVEHRTDKGSTSVLDTQQGSSPNHWEYICLNGWGTQDESSTSVHYSHIAMIYALMLRVHLPQMAIQQLNTDDNYVDAIMRCGCTRGCAHVVWVCVCVHTWERESLCEWVCVCVRACVCVKCITCRLF